MGIHGDFMGVMAMKSGEPTFLSLYTATPWFPSAKAGTKPDESYEVAYPNKTSACDKSL